MEVLLDTVAFINAAADPFDRLLIATAVVLGVPALTGDAIFDRYPIEVLRF